MLFYLCGHSCPDISFAVHQCARYTFYPKASHEAALKRIGRYLKGTANKGLILDPRDNFRIDCYPNADFAGLYGHKHHQDPHCARSRTGYVINLLGCPILWSSRMQRTIYQSTSEAEYVALSDSCKDLFPLIDLLQELLDVLDLESSPSIHLHVQVHEDNVGALSLGRLEPRRMTPRSKHYAIKYHWFPENIGFHQGPYGTRNVELVKIASVDQLGDIFTKGLPVATFVVLQKKLMGW